jgi:hypothetical protein
MYTYAQVFLHFLKIKLCALCGFVAIGKNKQTDNCRTWFWHSKPQQIGAENKYFTHENTENKVQYKAFNFSMHTA